MTMPDPFDALGVPARPDLDDETVRAAWRAIAAATHPDRADGGDPARYAQASAAYAELRTPWGRSEAYADLLDARGPDPGPDDGPGTEPIPAYLDPAPPPPGYLPLSQLPARIWHGRKLRLLLRAAIAALLSLAVLALIPGQPAEPAVITGLITWFLLTSRWKEDRLEAFYEFVQLRGNHTDAEHLKGRVEMTQYLRVAIRRMIAFFDRIRS